MKKLIAIILSLIISTIVRSQDIQTTQFFASPSIVNPAFAGVNACSKFVLLHRNQWRGVSTAYRTYLGTFDHYFANKNFGISAVVSSDQSGTGALKNNYVAMAFAYEAVIGRLSSLRFALQPGLGTRSINFNKLYFGDQIARGGNVSTLENPVVKRSYFDLGAGILYTHNNFWIGASASHINRYNESFYNNSTENMPLKYSVQTGGRFLLNKAERDEKEQRSLIVVLVYKGQQKFDQADVGLYYNQRYCSIGLWYRGIPGLKAYKPGYQNNDALAVVAGLSYERYKLGYSYDLTISKLSLATAGSHELSLSYQVCKTPKKRVKRNNRAVYCPTF
jgi:type IX secretion system PorP/SprF family membrane protein